MGRTAWLMVALALALAACGTSSEASDDAEPTTSTSIGSGTTTTSVATTTTVEEAAECDLVEVDPNSALVFEAGCSYVNSIFAVPMTYSPDRDGWVSFGYGSRWVSLDLDEDADGTTDAALTVLLFQENREPEGIFESIVSRDRITAEGNVMETTIGGLPASALDIRLAEHSRFPCGNRISRFLNTGSYIALVNDGPNRTFGIPACRTSRVWAVTVGDITATVVGAVRNDAAFDELMPILGGFLENTVTFGDADG